MANTAPNGPWAVPQRVALLRQLWADPTVSTAEMGRRIGVSKASVLHKAHRLKLPGRASPIIVRHEEGVWTPERDALLEILAPTAASTSEIARRLDVSRWSVTDRIRARGLKKGVPKRHTMTIAPGGNPRKSPGKFTAHLPEPSFFTQIKGRLWDTVETEYLRENWGVMPSAEIAAALKLTGWAVIKRARVLGLRRLTGGVPSTRPKPPPRVVMPVYIPRHQHPCAWPIGEPGRAGLRFCDEAAVFGKPYCATCCAKAYVAVREKAA